MGATGSTQAPKSFRFPVAKFIVDLTSECNEHSGTQQLHDLTELERIALRAKQYNLPDPSKELDELKSKTKKAPRASLLQLPGKRFVEISKEDYCSTLTAYFSRVLDDALTRNDEELLSTLASVQVPYIYAKILDFALSSGNEDLAKKVINFRHFPDDDTLSQYHIPGDPVGCTICVIVRRGTPDILREYLKNTEFNSSTQEQGNVALAQAVQFRDPESKEPYDEALLEMIQILLDEGADGGALTNIPSKDSYYDSKQVSTFFRAVHNGDIKAAELLLGKEKKGSESKKSSKRKPVKDVNLVGPDFGYTTVWVATNDGDYDTLQFLIKNNADVNKSNPLLRAITMQREDLVCALYSGGAKVQLGKAKVTNTVIKQILKLK